MLMINWQALVCKPKLVKLDTKLIDDINKPNIPIPLGPRNNATNFDLIILIIIENICTPPNKEVALII